MTGMKILHINQNYTGNSLHKELISALKECGVENYVYCAERNWREGYEDDNVVVSSILKIRHRISAYLKRNIILKDISKRWDVRQFDCIHCYTLIGDGMVGYELSRQYGIPFVVAVRNTDINDHLRYRFYLRKLAQRIMKGASSIFFLSEAYRQQMFKRYVDECNLKQISSKVSLIPNGLTDFWLRNPTMPIHADDGSCIRVSCVGALVRNKNIETVAAALALIQRRGIEVSLEVASGTEDANILKELRRYQFLKYRGKLDRNAIKEMFARTNVFALVSHHESFGMVYIEAMSQGLPIVYTKGQGFDGWFKDGEVGYSADSHDVEQVAEAIYKAYQRRCEIRQTCLAEAQRFSWHILVQEYLRHYSSAISRD